MGADETVYVNGRRVSCDGGEFGHPRVFLEMGEADHVECPYCSRRFVLADAAEDAEPAQ